MPKRSRILWGLIMLCVLTLGQGCKQEVQVKANYKVDKKGKHIELTLRSYKFAEYTLASPVRSWNKSKKRAGMIGGMGRERVHLYLRDVKPGTYKVTIRVFTKRLEKLASYASKCRSYSGSWISHSALSLYPWRFIKKTTIQRDFPNLLLNGW